MRCTSVRIASLALIAVVAACSGPGPQASASLTPSAAPTAQISVTKVTIHTGVDPTRRSQNPLYTYALARGHYIIQTPTSGGRFVAYDGRQLANLDPTDGASVYLSGDGTHYGYRVNRSSGAADIYVDGKLYVSAPTGLLLFALTNSGEPVYSTFARSPDVLYRGGHMIAEAPRGFVIVRISGDGSHWLAYERSDGGGPGPLVLDGSVLLQATTSYPQDQFVLLSDNGKHWSCYLQEVGAGTLLIDGVTRSTSPGLQSPEITSSGHVAWVDNVDGSAHVDDRVISSPSPVFGVSINDDASHVLVVPRDGPPTLDGTPIDLGIGTFTAEVVGSTVYAYTFVQ